MCTYTFIHTNSRTHAHTQVWYTGIGAPDLIRRSCADIGEKLKLVCDGVEVLVPPDAEGLIITNINCHMGECGRQLASHIHTNTHTYTHTHTHVYVHACFLDCAS